MNGVHDMGGMHGFGPVLHEANEPVFHAAWEGRVRALSVLMGAWRLWNIDAGRHSIERLPPADYLRMSYFEKWFAGLVGLLARTGLVSREELAAGRSMEAAPKLPPLRAENVAAALARGGASLREIAAQPRFAVGAKVRARNLNPVGHTRLPRYVRGRSGQVTAHHGAHVFPDTNAHGEGERPQHLYQVRFGADELWGMAQRNAVYLDLWESYLEPG